MTDKEPVLPSVLCVEPEQEKEVTQQLKQANDTVVDYKTSCLTLDNALHHCGKKI